MLRENKIMKNRTLAIFGIGTYISSVLSSATNQEGNSIAPAVLIIISIIAGAVFVVMATVRLWKKARHLSIMLVSTTIIILVLEAVQALTLPSYGSPIIILLNIANLINFIVFIWAIIILFKNKNN